MFEYIRSPDIYRATSLFAFTVLAYKKHPLGALAALVRYSRIVVPVYRDSDSGLNISSEPGSIIIPSSIIIRGVVKSGVKYVK